MKLSSRLLFLLVLSPLTASAVTISVDADILREADGVTPMRQSGLVVLTAATNGVFHGPSGTSFVTDDEMLLYAWDLTAAGFGMDGTLSEVTAALSFTGDWDQGDPLRIYWYPTLTLAAMGPTTGIPFGFYSDPDGIDISMPWITPAEADNISLSFFTSDSGFFTGSNDPAAGVASNVVRDAGPGPSPVPENGHTLFLMSLCLAGFAVMHRFRMKSRGC